MKLVRKDSEWEITGPEKDRAWLAFAILNDGRLYYELSEALRANGELDDYRHHAKATTPYFPLLQHDCHLVLVITF